MSKAFVFIALLAVGSVSISSAAAQTASPGGSQFGPSSAWMNSPGSFATTANAACGHKPSEDCFAGQMQKAGATPEAVAFSRALDKVNHEAGYMSSFNHVGPVDIAWVLYPLRPSAKYGLMLINGSPSLVNAEDLKLLDSNGLQQSLQYQTLKGQFPKVGVWPGDRDGQTWPSSQSGPNGGVQFTLGYPLRNGCATCAHAGFALFTWNFDSTGKFLGTTFMGLTPPPLKQSSSPTAMLR